MSEIYVLVSYPENKEIIDFLEELFNYLNFVPIAPRKTGHFLKMHRIEAQIVEEVIEGEEGLSWNMIHPKIIEGISPSSNRTEKLHIPIVIISPEMIGSISKPETLDLEGEFLLKVSAKSALTSGKSLPLCDPKDFSLLIEHLENVQKKHAHLNQAMDMILEIDPIFRVHLAKKVFALTGQVDQTMTEGVGEDKQSEALPETLHFNKKRSFLLKYGENPYQEAAFYGESLISIMDEKLLSKTNLENIEIGALIVKKFETSCCTIVKHTNPCIVAIGHTPLEAFQKVFATDPKATWGGVLVFNEELDLQTAKNISNFFFSLVAAPHFTEAALAYLRQKKRLILVQLKKPPSETIQIKQVLGGMVYEKTPHFVWENLPMNVVTNKHPTQREKEALLLAAKVNAEVKSNSVVIAQEDRTVGIGAGQQNRLGAIEVATAKAGKQAKGGIASSDGFFPFPDAIKYFARAGVQAIIQPGGSQNDDQIIHACNKEGIAMVFTGIRLFKH